MEPMIEGHDDVAAAPASSPVPAPAAAPAHSVLMGPYGLRAGWGALLFTVFVVIALIVSTLLAITVTGRWKHVMEVQREAAAAKQAGKPAPHPAADEPIKPGRELINESLQFGCVALAAFGMAKIERRRMAVFGIGRSRIGDVLPGALWGLLFLSALVGLLRGLHLLVFDGLALHGFPILRYGAEWLVMFFFVGLLEEYLMRGYLQYTLTRGFYGVGASASPRTKRAIAFWLAAVLMSTIFAMLHLSNGGENAMGITMVFLAGMIFSYALWHTGSLWWGIGFHMTWDWAQSFLWGVPDSGQVSFGRLLLTHPQGNKLLSGGSAGPEGSVFVIPILLLVLLAIRMAPAGEQPPLEPEAPAPEALAPLSVTF